MTSNILNSLASFEQPCVGGCCLSHRRAKLSVQAHRFLSSLSISEKLFKVFSRQHLSNRREDLYSQVQDLIIIVTLFIIASWKWPIFPLLGAFH